MPELPTELPKSPEVPVGGLRDVRRLESLQRAVAGTNETEPESPSDTCSPAIAALTSASGQELLERAIAALPKLERRVVLLRHFGASSRSVDAVANDVGLTRVVVALLEQRALRRLRDELSPLVVAEELRRAARRSSGLYPAATEDGRDAREAA
jgi:DNA-directed RNA polymerase specialized sigma subunit